MRPKSKSNLTIDDISKSVVTSWFNERLLLSRLEHNLKMIQYKCDDSIKEYIKDCFEICEKLQKKEI